MRILMLGWEFPPFISGGLGTACYGLTRAMARLGTEILFVLPSATGMPESTRPSRPVRPARRVSFCPVASPSVNPYGTNIASARHERSASAPLETDPSSTGAEPEEVVRVLGAGAAGGYEGNLLGRIMEYAHRCVSMTEEESFDAIHAHDWVTFPAGLAIATRFRKPLIVHVHSTEFDRSGENINQAVYDIERMGVHAATSVIAVSHLTKSILVDRYGVRAKKIRVVHNGIEPRSAPPERAASREKVVLFLGRLTVQKGPGYFVEAARRIADRHDDIKFVVAGWGDMGPQIVSQVAAMGLGDRFRFAGFLGGQDVRRAYQMADVYVMPSVSEPFGLTALEAIQNGVPVIVSRRSGVAEVLNRGAIKIDGWNVDEMADRIVSVVKEPEVADALRREAAAEIRGITWDCAARKCVQVYREMMPAA